MKRPSLLFLLMAVGCATPPTEPVAELCLEGECLLVPREHAEFIMDWCEFKLPENESLELNLWSKRNIATNLDLD